MKTLFAGRVYCKIDECNTWISQVKKIFPESDIIIFCNYPDISGIKHDQIIRVTDQNSVEYPSVPNTGHYRFQIGASLLLLESSLYISNLNYDYVCSFEVDEVFIDDNIKKSFEDVKNYDAMMWIYNGNPWPSYLQYGCESLFDSTQSFFNNFSFNAEQTCKNIFSKKHIKYIPRKDKLGYCPVFGNNHRHYKENV